MVIQIGIHRICLNVTESGTSFAMANDHSGESGDREFAMSDKLCHILPPRPEVFNYPRQILTY